MSAGVRLLVLAGVGILAVTGHFMPGLDGSVLENGVRNSLHVIGFAVVATVIFEIVPAGIVVRGLVAVMVAGLIGVIAEYAQTPSGRSDIVDIYRDLSGAGCAVVGRAIWMSSISAGPRFRLALRTASVLVTLLAFSPLAYWLGITGSYLNKLPTILDFDGKHDSYLFHSINASTEILEPAAGDGSAGNAVGVRLSRAGRSGIAVSTVGYDWRDYSILAFDAGIVDGPPGTVTVHINDKAHIGRFFDTTAGKFTVTDKMQRIRIPIDSVLTEISEQNIEKSDIRQIVILARDRQTGALLRIDDIHLE